jgi:molybdenum cofactor sulfurtransferase
VLNVQFSSQCSSSHADQARRTTLQFFDAPEEEYIVVFTSSTTASLKLVGESFPFTAGSKFILPVDAHNSLHGVRSFATAKGAEVVYLESPEEGGIFLDQIKVRHSFQSFGDFSCSIQGILDAPPGSKNGSAPSIFAFSGQSNITNTRTPLSIASYAKQRGYYTVLDAAALAPTCPISLRNSQVDAMAISFYKMFGYPTGVGALIMKREFAEMISRTKPWFAGGTVDFVQVPGNIVTYSELLEERFENGKPAVIVLSRRIRPVNPGDEEVLTAGSTVSMFFLQVSCPLTRH